MLIYIYIYIYIVQPTFVRVRVFDNKSTEGLVSILLSEGKDSDTSQMSTVKPEWSTVTAA
jgi:hypothetical protein